MKRRTRIACSIAALGLAFGVAATGLGAHVAAARSDPLTTESSVTRLTTGILEHSQFAHHPFDDELAGTLLDRYLDSLDPTRTLFLRSDVDEFARYRGTLAQATRETGDTRAAHAIFSRYLDRLAQRVSSVSDALRTTRFDFTGHDVYSFDREHAQRPRDLPAARKLWRQALRAEYLQEKLDDRGPEAIARALTQRHAQQLRTMQALGNDEVLEIYLNALAHVYDPHSDYMGREEMDSFSIAMNLSLVGIGATLETSDGYCSIRGLVPGGPAARSGLIKPGDRIVAVAQDGKEPVDITNVPLSRAVELIRGPKGSTVTLTILPGGTDEGSPSRTASIVRDAISLEDQKAKARIEDLPTGKGKTLRLGVIDLPSFYAGARGGDATEPRSATADVARLLAKLKAEKVRGIVLDLRRNGGGSLDEAISLTGLFIPKGPVVQTRDPAGHIVVGADTDGTVLYDGPLVLLTSRFSASASEILAGALQDYGRAVVVGDSSTFGKGTVQTVLPLERAMDTLHLPHAFDPGALKVTIDKFYRPSGASTQLRGVASDIVLPSTSDFRDVSESALKDPLPWDTVPSALYEPMNRVAPYLSALRASSARRVASETDFGYLAGDVAKLKANLALKVVSLNEAERREEAAQTKARHDAEDVADRALRDAAPTTYEITLNNASLPGLPPATSSGSGSDQASARLAPPAGDHPMGLSRDRSFADDVILSEGVSILADYVNLASAP